MSKWIESDTQWYEQQMIHCSSCGRLIAKNLLVATIDGEDNIFCGEECEQLYRDYVLPVRGADFIPPPDVLDQYEELMIK